MCERKPGPRCSQHARMVLNRARSTLNTAHQHDFSADALAEAQDAYNEALSDYETTPEGQQRLQDAIDQLHADGDEVAAVRAEQCLADAKERRRQLKLLAGEADQYQQRLPVEGSGVAPFDEAESVVAWTKHRLTDAQQLSAACIANYELMATNTQNVKQECRQLEALAADDSVSAGEREAAAEQLEEATRERVRCQDASRWAWAERAESSMELMASRDAYFDAMQERNHVGALIGSGFPVGDNFRHLYLNQPHSVANIRRTNDGLNVAIYEEPSDGFTYGRFIRASDTTATANGTALLFPDGTVVDGATDNATLMVFPVSEENTDAA